MAQEYTPEEIDEIVRIANEELKQFGYVTAATKERLKDAEIGIKNYTATLKASMSALGTSMKQLGRGILDGKIGAEQYSDALEKGADAISSFASKFGIVGKLLGGAVKGVTAYTSAVSKQADALTKSYQDIARAGAGTAGGITDVFESMQKLNYGLDELADFGALVKANSETLTSFGLTAGQGVKQLANLGAEIQRSDIGYQFRLMGMSVDDINKGIAGYLKLQTLTGGIGKKSAEDQAKAAAEYVRELDTLTKITGKTKEDTMAAQESAMAEERYAAFKYELQQRANMGDAEAKERLKQIEANQVFLDKVGPETRKGFLNILSGAVDTPEAQKLLLTMPNAAAEAGKQTFDANAFQQAALKDINANLAGAGTSLAKIGANNDTFIAIQEQMRLKAALETGTIDERRAAAEKEQNVTDSATKNMIQMQDAQRAARDSLQSLVNAGIKPVTSAMKGLAGTIESITGIPGAVAPSLAPKTAPTPAPKTAPGAAVDRSLIEKLSSSGITDRRAQANILAQVQAESGGVPRSENLNYTPEQLLKTFPKYVKSMADAESLVAGGAEAIGNRIYGGRMGNEANEGYKYRGRGLIQLTGKDNYAKFGKMLGIDLVNNPDLANDPEVARNIAVAYFNEKQRRGTDLTDIAAIGKAVGYVGGADETARRGQISQQILDSLPAAATGGILSGAQSGYPAVLHGTEAVVPLPDGKTIPVEIAGGSISPEHIEKLTAMLNRLETSVAGNQTQSAADIMTQQLIKMDELVNAMRSQLSVSQQILQYTQ